MGAASAVKANKPVCEFGPEGSRFVPGTEPGRTAAVARGMPYPAARVTVRRFSPHHQTATSRAGASSAGWREFLLRTGLGEFMTPAPLAASAAGRRGRWAAPTGRGPSPRRYPDGPGDDAVRQVDAATSVTSAR